MRKAKEIRTLEKEQLNEEVARLRKDLFVLRNKHALSQLETKHEIRQTRRELAQILTVIAENDNA